MRLPERDVEKHAVVLEHSMYLELSDDVAFRVFLQIPYLFKILARIVLHFVRGTPGAAVYHRIEGALVESNVDRLVGKADHVPYIHVFPFYARYVFMSFGHGLDDNGGEIDAKLLCVAKRREFGGYYLDEE